MVGKVSTNKAKIDGSESKRFLELDFLRGMAVIGMIIFHFFFLLNYFGVLSNDMFSGWWHVLGQFVRFSFLGLVGAGIVISYNKVIAGGGNWWQAVLRQWKRAFLVLILALVVSYVTYMFIPEVFVKFGILHLIALSIFILSFFVRLPYIALVLALIAIGVGQYIKDFTTDSLPFFILGLKSSSIFSIDYFPVFPWISVPALGIFFGAVLYEKRDGVSIRDTVKSRSQFLSCKNTRCARVWRQKFLRFASELGRHSLFIYMFHVPFIILLFVLFGIVDLEFFGF